MRKRLRNDFGRRLNELGAPRQGDRICGGKHRIEAATGSATGSGGKKKGLTSGARRLGRQLAAHAAGTPRAEIGPRSCAKETAGVSRLFTRGGAAGSHPRAADADGR